MTYPEDEAAVPPPTYTPGDLLFRVLPEGATVPNGWTLHTWTLYGHGLIYRTATEAGTAPHGTRVVTPAEGAAITEAAARAGSGVPWDGRGADSAAVVHAVVQHDRHDDGRPWSY